MNIEHVIGTAEVDILTGTDADPETIEGGDGGDTLVGGDRSWRHRLLCKFRR